IITLLVGLGIILFSILIFTGVVSGKGNVTSAGSFILIIGIIISLFSLLKFWASGLMKDPLTTSKGGVVALIAGILNGGDLLSIVGGILGIVQGSKEQ
ncbi:hypothetical protein D6817_02085, partial [Candidatus Pacearchaeota archaeon]